VESLSVRETLDQIECLQLHWGPVLSECGQGVAEEMLRALMARLGEIASHAYPVREDGPVLDDPQHITPLPGAGGEGLGILSRKSLRQTICVLMALARVHDITSRAKEVPIASDEEVQCVEMALRQHHIEASMDCFNDLQQMVYLAPGQRLAYRTGFHGMYNDVSQVSWTTVAVSRRTTALTACCCVTGSVLSSSTLLSNRADRAGANSEERVAHDTIGDAALARDCARVRR
jgi:hypothetical protein